MLIGPINIHVLHDPNLWGSRFYYQNVISISSMDSNWQTQKKIFSRKWSIFEEPTNSSYQYYSVYFLSWCKDVRRVDGVRKLIHWLCDKWQGGRMEQARQLARGHCPTLMISIHHFQIHAFLQCWTVAFRKILKITYPLALKFWIPVKEKPNLPRTRISLLECPAFMANNLIFSMISKLSCAQVVLNSILLIVWLVHLAHSSHYELIDVLQSIQ